MLSPGNDGAGLAVEQRRLVSRRRQPELDQPVGQPVGAGGSGIQSSQQAAGTDQVAAALSAATQYDPSNTNVAIRVLSPGNDGSVTQSNNAASRADAGNAASTTQSGSQSQAGSSCGCERLDADPDVRPVGVDGSNGSRTLGREADRPVEHERVDPRAEPR